MRQTMAGPASGGIALVALALGCGADSVNVGDRPGPVGGDSPDAGGSLVEGSTSCNIPNLGQYRLLFDSDGGKLERRIYSMRADGTEIEALTPPEELAREPALSPDGRQLAYVTPEGIRLRDMASGNSELIAPSTDHPQWSPDGTLLYYRDVSNSGCIERMSVAERSTAVLGDYLACGEAATSMDLTPDGSRIVFRLTSSQEGIQFGYALYLFTIDVGPSTQIVPPTPVLMDDPTVSPDGVWLAAAYDCDADGSSLWASPLQVLTPACEGRRITPADAPSATNPQWGPGVLIAYERGEPPRDIAIIAADTGEECIIEGPGDDRNPTWGLITPSVPE
jgi:Tol biopolymer transport system component